MSRIGKKPVLILAGVTVTQAPDGTLTVKGPKGELFWKPSPLITVKVGENEILVSRDDESQLKHSLHGLTRTLIQNMIIGVTQGYSKTLEINGVGYRMAIQGNKLVLNLGYSHPIEFTIPKGVSIKLKDSTSVTVSGPDKQLVGEVSARLRGYFPAEPYKGKGIRYKGEHVRRKAGKAVA